jgi:hypothetical protein
MRRFLAGCYSHVKLTRPSKGHVWLGKGNAAGGADDVDDPKRAYSGHISLISRVLAP